MNCKMKVRSVENIGAAICCSDAKINTIKEGFNLVIHLFDCDCNDEPESCYVVVDKISKITPEIQTEIDKYLFDWSEDFHDSLMKHCPVGPEKFKCVFNDDTRLTNGDELPKFKKGDTIIVKRSCIWNVYPPI